MRQNALIVADARTLAGAQTLPEWPTVQPDTDAILRGIGVRIAQDRILRDGTCRFRHRGTSPVASAGIAFDRLPGTAVFGGVI